MTNALSINRLINVTVNLSPSSASFQNISTLLILGSTSVIDVVERRRSYTGIDGVALDFGTTSPEYLAAVLWFEQAPQPTTLQIGRWAKTDTAGKLVGATLSAADQLISAWTSITNGSFDVTIDGGTPQALTALDFSGDTNLNGVASTITTALTGATCVWNSNFSRFEFTSATTGATSTVSFLTSGTVGTDISGMLGGLATSSGAYVADGIVAETALEAVTLFDQNFGQDWYAVALLGGQDSDYVAISGYIEAATNKHLNGVTSQEAGTLVSTDTSNVGYQLKQLARKRSPVQYSSSNPYAVCSLLGRILTTDYNANNSVITLMYKQEPGIVPETLNVTQMNALEGNNVNVFVAYNNNTAIIEPGIMPSGDFIDTITGVDWLALDIQTTVYNLLYTSTTKVPQTNPGNHQLVTAIESVLIKAVNNGLIAPGIWNSGGFGALSQGDYLAKGYYIYAPPISSQAQADRELRKSVSIQVAVKLAGAIHTVDIQINVNR
jgi:hypothetical protein